MDLSTKTLAGNYSFGRQNQSSRTDTAAGLLAQNASLSTNVNTGGDADRVGTTPPATSKLDTYTPSKGNDDSSEARNTSNGPLVYSMKMLKGNLRDTTKESASTAVASSVSDKSASEPARDLSSSDTSSHGGANADPGDIASPAAATKMIQDLKRAGGGTLRIQMTHDQVNDSTELAKLKALLDEGDKQGIKVQFTYRDNANGGGGNVLTGDKLKQAAEDISNVVKKYGSRPSFVLDTFNEGGAAGYPTQDWADMQTTFITSARNTGYKGVIAVEDANWGGGLTAGPESGLVKYAAQLKEANGRGSPALIGSIHEYANDKDASARLGSEIKGLVNAGYQVQIGEVGNANWLNGNIFEERDVAITAVKDNLAILKAIGADILPWKDQFQSHVLHHQVGFSKSDQYY